MKFLTTAHVQLHETNDEVFAAVMGMRILDLIYVSSLMDKRITPPEGEDYQTPWTLKDFRNLRDFFYGGVCQKAADQWGRRIDEIYNGCDAQLRPKGLSLRTATLYLNAMIARHEKTTLKAVA